jgi:hypothetical protein
MKMHTSARARARGRGAARGGLVLATVALAAGCSGDSVATTTTDDGLAGGPLADLLGYGISPADSRANELKVQQAIAECMKGEGWEYQPVDFSSQNGNLDEFDEQLSDPVSYGTKYGYGVVRGYDLGQDQDTTVFVDPNTEYVNSLSADEMASYDVSLYGTAAEAPVGDEEAAAPPLEQQGCYGQAQAEVYGDSPLADPDVSTRLDELSSDAQNDPKILDAYDVWAACMTERDGSYEFATPDEIYNYLYGELAAAQGFGQQAASGFVRGVNPGDTLPEVDQDAIEALRAEEMQIWTDDQACQVETDIPGIRKQVEQQMVDQLVQDFPELGEQ